MSQDDTNEHGSFLAAQQAIRRQLRPVLAPPVNTILPPELADLSRQLSAALDDARAIIQLAQQEAISIREEARREGLQQGLCEASEALALARVEYQSLHDRAEQDLVKLALSLARKIVGHHLEANPASLADMISRTLQLARGRRHIELRVNTEDLPALQPYRERFTNAVGNPSLFIIADPDVPPGGCRIETEAGFINADLDLQLQALANALGVEPWGESQSLKHD